MADGVPAEWLSELQANIVLEGSEVLCTLCDGAMTIPIRMPDGSGGYVDTRYTDHGRGSETCTQCSGTGKEVA